jgi:hypothetical protein
MKFTDRFFEFPIKIYDGFSLKKAMEQEEALDAPVDADWVRGYIKIPAAAITDIYWYDVFSKGRTVEEIADKGFDATAIVHPDLGEFECTWRREKFENELNSFVERLEKAGAIEY